MNRIKRFIGSHIILIITILILTSHGDLEFCSKSGSDGMFWIDHSNCLYGILFPEPVTVDCLVTTNTGVMKSDVCNDTDVDTSIYPIQVQYVPEDFAGLIAEEDSCNKPEKCGGNERINDTAWASKILPPSLLHKNEPWPEYSTRKEASAPSTATNGSTGLNQMYLVDNQTLRMFKHLMGFTNDEQWPNLRIITILRKSFEILGKFCSNRYVSLDFGEDILSAFLFLLGEADTSRIMDIGMDEYRKIDGALNDCLDQPNPFKVSGSTCRSYGYIETINTTKGPVKFTPNEFSWKADKYDIPVDVTWATMDFVHGLCYGTFKNHVNSHHLYQQAIERIFLPEIIARWDKPTLLKRPDVWDNFFSANVRTAIENLEFCVQAAYYEAPFLHRLERMLEKFAGGSASGVDNAVTTPAPKNRKKRETGVSALPSIENLRFYCFKTEQYREDILRKYKTSVC